MRYSMRYFFIVCGLMVALCMFAQHPADSLFVNKASKSLEQVITAPQEKVYLHTDKFYYFAGDTIWIKGYLMNAVSHLSSQGSQFIYIELNNRKDKIIERFKFKINETGFNGAIPLPNDIAEGDYYIRAYTQWMRNTGEEYFFSKNLKIIASQLAFMKPSIRYEQREGKRTATITFARSEGGLYDNHQVHYMVRTKDKGNRFRQQKTNKKGEISIDIPERISLEQYIYIILEDGLLKHKHTFYVPNAFDFEVDFFPEGGHLIANSNQKVAFKAVDSNGNSVDVDGFVLNQKGDTITRFDTSHAGIGAFMLSTNEGDSYEAVVRAPNGNSKRVELPKPETDKYALTTISRNDILRFNILHSNKQSLDKTFYLLVHIRGFILLANRITASQGAINMQGYPEGVLTLTLFDEDFIPQSERLTFIRRDDTDWTVVPDKESYDARSPVTLDLSLTDKSGAPLHGNFSMSVTDNYAVAIDSTGTNILSHVLLTSDIKGYVESPGYYFKENTPRTRACIDNLMLTHGWSRFDIKALMEEKARNPEFFMEMSQSISGRVTGPGGKPLDNKMVSVFLNKQMLPPVATDKQGVFVINNIEFVGSASIEARLYEGSKLVKSEVKIDRDNFPVAFNKQPYPTAPVYQEQQSEYMEALQSPFVMEDGILVSRLPEVVITSKSIMRDRFSSYKMDDEEMIAQKDARTAFDLVNEVPGVQIIDNRPYLNPVMSLRPTMSMSNDVANRNAVRPTTKMSYGPVLRFTLDGKRFSYDNLKNIDASEIASVYKVDPEVASAFEAISNDILVEEYQRALEEGLSLEELEELDKKLYEGSGVKEYIDGGKRTSGGEIALVSRTGKLRVPTFDSQKDHVYLMGLSKYKNIYQPRYDTPEKKASLTSDNRTTIHWVPTFKLDENGKGRVNFFTADRPGFYTVVIEGMTNKGVPCRYEYLLRR